VEGPDRERQEDRMKKAAAKLTAERRDARNAANAFNAADSQECCSDCGRRLAEVGGGDCDTCRDIHSSDEAKSVMTSRPALDVPSSDRSFRPHV